MDKAVQAVMEMTDTRDTLILVTSDHAHSMTMNGYPGRHTDILGMPCFCWQRLLMAVVLKLLVWYAAIAAVETVWMPILRYIWQRLLMAVILKLLVWYAAIAAVETVWMPILRYIWNLIVTDLFNIVWIIELI